MFLLLLIFLLTSGPLFELFHMFLAKMHQNFIFFYLFVVEGAPVLGFFLLLSSYFLFLHVLFAELEDLHLLFG